MWEVRNNHRSEMQIFPSIPTLSTHPQTMIIRTDRLAPHFLTTTSYLVSLLPVTLQCQHAYHSSETTGCSDVLKPARHIPTSESVQWFFPECLLPSHLHDFLLCSFSLSLNKNLRGLLKPPYIKQHPMSPSFITLSPSLSPYLAFLYSIYEYHTYFYY